MSFSNNSRIMILASLAITLLLSQTIDAQNDSAKPTVNPTDWKANQLKQIAQALSFKTTNPSEREEFLAQQRWLRQWAPGKMSAHPSSTNRLSVIRKEPIFESEPSTPLRGKLNWNDTNQDASNRALLEQAIANHPDDLGIRQLHLNWLDLPFRRKSHLNEVDESVSRLIDLLKSQDQPNPKIRLALEFALYRKGRALAYRELPDVVAQSPIQDQEKLNRDLNAAFEDLIQMSGKRRPEFILLEIRMLRRQKRYGSALGLVEEFGTSIPTKWYLKKRRDLLEELDWQPPYREAAALFAKQFPDEE